MSDAGRELLDSSEWIIESAASLPDLTALSCVSFMISPSLQERAGALLEAEGESGPIARFLFDAVELEVEVRSALTLDSESWNGGFAQLARTYGEVSGLEIEGQDIADLLGELRVPLFESQPEISETIEKWGGRASAVVGAVGTVAAGAGKAGAVLVLIAPPLGAAILIGTYSAIGGIALAGFLRRRRQAREKRRAEELEAARRRRVADAEKAAVQAEKEYLADQHRLAKENQDHLKARLKAKGPRKIDPW